MWGDIRCVIFLFKKEVFMVNFEAVKKLLESQGKLDFKPFHFDNAKQEYWAYRTNDNKFHIYQCG